MVIPPQDVQRIIGLLIWIGGVTTTAIGALFASKIHVYHENRKAHLDELRDKVLVPFRVCLEGKFAPLVALREPAIDTRWDESFFAKETRSTEPQTRSRLVLEAVNPWPQFRASVDPALYQDARRKHFAELLKSAEEFASAWTRYAEQVCQWVQEMSQQLSEKSGLPPLQPGPGSPLGLDLYIYADHDCLASFAYRRICHFQAPCLAKASSGGQFWTLRCGSTNAAMGPADELDDLTESVDELIANQQEKGEFFRNRAEELARQFESLKDDVHLAIATMRLRKGCDLVAFF